MCLSTNFCICAYSSIFYCLYYFFKLFIDIGEGNGLATSSILTKLETQLTMQIMLIYWITDVRIICIASCANFVSGFIKIDDREVANPFPSLLSMGYFKTICNTFRKTRWIYWCIIHRKCVLKNEALAEFFTHFFFTLSRLSYITYHNAYTYALLPTTIQVGNIWRAATAQVHH